MVKYNEIIKKYGRFAFNPLEFYKREFTKDYELISDLLDEPLFSLNTLTQFTELYLDYLTNFYPSGK
jgi:uncharacterized protein YozE (UPF0346 family)